MHEETVVNMYCNNGKGKNELPESKKVAKTAHGEEGVKKKTDSPPSGSAMADLGMNRTHGASMYVPGTRYVGRKPMTLT